MLSTISEGQFAETSKVGLGDNRRMSNISWVDHINRCHSNVLNVIIRDYTRGWASGENLSSTHPCRWSRMGDVKIAPKEKIGGRSLGRES
jgi:hypothetical protein